MHSFLLCAGLALLTIASTEQTSGITYKTVSIFNEAYVVADNWGAIPVDPSGEDVNSRRYGGVYFPPSIRDTDKKESRTTLARGYMELEVDLLNTTQDVYQLDYLTLTVTAEYEASSQEYETGQWDIRSRTSTYRPHFKIEPGKPVITRPVEEVVIWPEEEYMDSRFIFEVSAPGGSNTIYAFTFTLTFSNQDDEAQKLEITSDKTYFIAPETVD